MYQGKINFSWMAYVKWILGSRVKRLSILNIRNAYKEVLKCINQNSLIFVVNDKDQHNITQVAYIKWFTFVIRSNCQWLNDSLM